MRTTIDVDEELLRRAKRKATDEGITFKEIVERALRTLLENHRGTPSEYHLRWRIESGRIRPGGSKFVRGVS